MVSIGFYEKSCIKPIMMHLKESLIDWWIDLKIVVKKLSMISNNFEGVSTDYVEREIQSSSLLNEILNKK